MGNLINRKASSSSKQDPEDHPVVVQRPTFIYNWRPDASDHDDKFIKFNRAQTPLEKVSHIGKCGPVFNQGTLGSCTANALSGAYTYRYNCENNVSSGGSDEFVPSRLFIYYNERYLEGTTGSDSGAQIKDGIITLKKYGVCPESMWPYDVSKFKDKPGDQCYTEAKKDHFTIDQHRVTQTLDDFKGCLEDGCVFAFGFVVFESFEDSSRWDPKTWIMPIPEEGERVMGGHAVLCVGFDDEKQCFIVRNSWGKDWGDNGNFYMPYDYMMGNFSMENRGDGETYWHQNDEGQKQAYCSDFWSIDKTFDN